MAVIYLIVLCILHSKLVYGGDFIPDRKCAVLYSDEDRQGDTLVMSHFDQVMSTQRDYRNSVSGWLKTGSVNVNENCTMVACDETYLRGNCLSITQKAVLPSTFISTIRSTNCTCQMECKCEDLSLAWYEYGRAYLEADCNTCDSAYLDLTKSSHANFPMTVKAFHIRDYCNLTLFSRRGFQGESILISERTQQISKAHFESYNFTCSKDSRKRFNSSELQQYVRLPNTTDDFVSFLERTEHYPTHAGVQAALMSAESGTSWRNAYILVLGTSNLDFTGIWGCPKIAPNHKIQECRIRVNLTDIGLLGADLRVIYINSEKGGIYNGALNDDSLLAASIDEYLSNHEDLQYAIPNAVIVWCNVGDIDYDDQNDYFVRKLAILNALRSRVMRQNDSNVIFQLSGYEFLSNSQEGHPEAIVDRFRKAIGDNWSFPQSLHVLFATDTVLVVEPTINGFWKLPSGEYFPRNLYQTLTHMCARNGDALGKAIIGSHFLSKSSVLKTSYRRADLLPVHHSKVVQFDAYLENPTIVPRRNGTIQLDMKLKFAIYKDRMAVRIKGLENRVEELAQRRELKSDTVQHIAEVIKGVKGEIVDMIKAELAKLFE